MPGRLNRWGLVALLGLGCSTASLAPADLAGTYQATTMSVVINGVTTNMLTSGASVALNLTADGQATGRVVVPPIAGVQVVAVDDDLAGTYTVINNHIQLKPTAGTYLSGLIFTADLPELRAYVTLNGATTQGQFTVILTRQ